MASYGVFPYFEFAAAADTASALIREKIEAIAPEIESVSSGMAGDEEVGKEWGAKWDTALNQFPPNACRLADAFGAIANRAYVAGVNFIAAEWVAAGRQGNSTSSVTCSAIWLPSSGNRTTRCGSSAANPGPRLPRRAPALRRIRRQHPGPRRDAQRRRHHPGQCRDHVQPGTHHPAPRHEHAIQELTITAAFTLAVGAAGTMVTATGSNWVSMGVTAGRVTTTGWRIRTLIETLQTASRNIGTTLTTLRVTANISALMEETISPRPPRAESGNSSPDRRAELFGTAC
ncbi:hypothetical protein ACIBEK_08595 [Nocardia fusca]|uniref:hypothetical protein n=1 Tax=Nocardia fusca TaxID=941183 RepID=UPI0037B46122